VRIAIVGASLAGIRAAQALRSAGSDDEITIIGDEIHAPYDRPPLSKGLLTGRLDVGDISLCADDELVALEVELVLGVRASALDLDARRVVIGGSDDVRYDEVVIATGSRARRLAPFEGLEGVHVLRTLDDALAVRDALSTSRGLAVVGAGFIGSEVASSACARGVPTTVIEAMDAPLSRVLGPTIGARLGRLHAEHGSVLRCGAGVDGPLGRGRVEGVRLVDGSVVDADLVLVGVGSVPNTDWLEDSDLDVADGILCDRHGRAGRAAHVHALGDVARWRSERFDDEVRTEHWTSAADQAAVVAADLLELPTPDEALPYVWSDQFGRRIQVAGRCRADDDVRVIRDDTDGFVAVTARGGHLVAVVAVDDPRTFGRLRRLVARGAAVEEAITETAR
jgi:NADPH-dependent 2,4-dienoyl-CoA reductase/sulfur reductase-like enzyme